MMAIRGSGGMASLLADEKDIVVPLKRNPVLFIFSVLCPGLPLSSFLLLLATSQYLRIQLYFTIAISSICNLTKVILAGPSLLPRQIIILIIII